MSFDNESITHDEWVSAIDNLAYHMEREMQMEHKLIKSVIRILEDNSPVTVNLSPSALEIYNRASHLDATHIGGHNNPAFYVTLDNRDYVLSNKTHKWIMCNWDTPCLDTDESFIRIKHMDKKKCIKYPGYMSEEVIDFCGEHNIEFKNRDGIAVGSYFLNSSNESETYMFTTNCYIIKSAKGNISITSRKPDFFE